MTPPSILEVEKLYNQKTTLHFVRFSNHKLATLNREITKLFKMLGDERELSFWTSIITTLKKVRFDLATLPVSPEHIIATQLIAQLNKELAICKISFPDSAEHLSKIIDRLLDFKGQENQFLSWISKNDTRDIVTEGLCLLSSRQIRLTEDIISVDEKFSARNLIVTSPRELTKFNFFDRIFLCGSISLFAENQFRNHEHVWRSPRAPNLYFLSYDWISENFKPESAFDIPSNKIDVCIVNHSVIETGTTEQAGSYVNAENIIDVGALDFSPADLISHALPVTTGHFESICEARLLLLEDGTAIYKEVDRSSRTVEFNQKVEIHKVENKKLEPGLSLVVRTEGSGDSIAAVADLLFGEKADQIRSMQEQWKTAFRKKMNSYESIYQVARVMTDLGAPTANETNVKNWQRSDTIKPNNENDFKSIMVFSGLPDIVDDYWKNAQKVLQMHKKAGKEISKLLLSRINDSSMEALEKYGRIDIEIDGLAGKVSVIRIESIMPDIYNVASGQLDKVINIEGEF